MNRIYISKLVILVAVFSGQSWGSFAQTSIFNYTGTVQTWTVPACVTSIIVDAQGALGGHGVISRGGYGGRVQCTLAVTPGTVLDIYVGGKGDTGVATAPGVGGAGGFNGGGAGSVVPGTWAGGGGGGATDIRIPPYGLANRVVVAAGGGGAGFNCYSIDTSDRGGDGGGLTGGYGYDCGVADGPAAGKGGTQIAGGAGGVYSGIDTGGVGLADSGGIGGSVAASGGGGSGWYGGGGGSWGGGGGGSSYSDATLATAVTHTSGYNTAGNGSITITIPCNPPGTITASGLTVCEGGTITLADPGSITCGTWSSSSSASVGTTTGVVTGVSAGTATIFYNIPNPCGGTSASITITVNPLPAAIAGTTTVCVGNTTTLADATGSGTWASGSTAVATVDPSTGVVTGVSVGAATISYTLSTGCMVTITVTVTACPSIVGQIPSTHKYKVDLFPNPVNNELTIKTEDGAYKTFTITNSIGQVLILQGLLATQTKVNVKDLRSGVYYITFKGEANTTVQRFVKLE